MILDKLYYKSLFSTGILTVYVSYDLIALPMKIIYEVKVEK